MSDEFSTILSAPQASGPLLPAIDDSLTGIDFNRGDSLYEVRWDSKRGVFDEAGEELIAGSSKTTPGKVAKWQGFATTYSDGDLKLYVMVASSDRFVNCYVDITRKTFERVFSEGKKSVLYRAYIALASSINATAGFGRMSLSFQPYSPEATIEAIWKNPEYPQDRSWLGLVSFNSISESDLRSKAGDLYNVIPQLNGYWLLEEREAMEIYEE